MEKTRFFAAVVLGWAVLSSVSFGYSGGDGTSGNPYQIAAKADLLSLITDYGNYNKCFILTADINLEGEIFETALFAIGCFCPLPMFSGTFDGNDHVIFNLTINRTTSGYGDKYLGLFGVVSSSGQIKNLGLEDIEIKGNFSGLSCVGGLVGLSYGNIKHCYTEGIINYGYYGSDNVGGLAGDNKGNIIDCYAVTQVRGARSVGGLAGFNSGNISNSYSAGPVTGNSYVGGFLGYNASGIIQSCYFLDIAGPDNGYGVPLNNTAMKQQSNFAGWDFTNETVNGTNDYWRMCADGVDYPRLNWESIDGDLQCPNGVNVEDLDYCVGRWLLDNCTSANNYCSGGDINASGVVDLADFAILAGHWLEGV